MRRKQLRYIILPAMLLAALLLGGCMPAPETPSETPIVLGSAKDLAAEVAKAAVPGAADPYGLKGLDFYFGLKTLPQGAEIKEIKVSPSVVRVHYTFGETKEDTFDNQLELVWYRKEDGNRFMANLAANNQQLNKIDGADGTAYLVTTAKAALPADTAQSYDYCHIVYWTEGGYAYMAAVPVSFADGEVGKYCHAQRVEVD